jgi:hypothetical protein
VGWVGGGGWYGWSGWVGGWVGVGWVEWGGWGRVPAVVCSSPSLQFLPTFFCSLQFFQLGSLQLVLSRSSVMGKGSKSGPSGFEELNTERKATSIVKHLHAAKTTYLIWALRCRANPAFRLYRKSDPTKIALKVTAEDAGLLFRGVTIYLRGVFAPLFIQVGLPPPSSAWWGFRTPLYPGGIAAPRFILGVPPPPRAQSSSFITGGLPSLPIPPALRYPAGVAPAKSCPGRSFILVGPPPPALSWEDCRWTLSAP